MSDGIIEKHTHKDFDILISIDEYPENPRNFDTIGTMVCYHKRYSLGDETSLKSSDFNGWDDLRNHLITKENAIVILPIYMYDHSGISLSTTPFSCSFDSGQVGFIYATKSTCRAAGYNDKITKEEIESTLRAEVADYSAYVSGEIYTVRIKRRVRAHPNNINDNSDIGYRYDGYTNISDAVQDAKDYIDSN